MGVFKMKYKLLTFTILGLLSLDVLGRLIVYQELDLILVLLFFEIMYFIRLTNKENEDQ